MIFVWHLELFIRHLATTALCQCCRRKANVYLKQPVLNVDKTKKIANTIIPTVCSIDLQCVCVWWKSLSHPFIYSMLRLFSQRSVHLLDKFFYCHYLFVAFKNAIPRQHEVGEQYCLTVSLYENVLSSQDVCQLNVRHNCINAHVGVLW